VKGYEYGRGQFVTFTPEELKALDVESAHSGDCDRPFQPKVITDSGDRDHVLTRPTESA